MGTFRTTIRVGDLPGGPDLALEALVDTGATYVTIPASRLRELGVQPVERRSFILADGRQAEYEVGFAMVALDGRRAPTLVVFGDEGSEPLVGAVILETLGLAADPVGKRLIPVPGYLLRLALLTQRLD
jgi:clan AA aspartic protease